MHRTRLAAALTVLAVTLALGVSGAEADGFPPGAPGIGDPYYPLSGNGGYDVRHYDLQVDYDPGTGVLDGRAGITARATQALSRFDLDLVGLAVGSVKVNGEPATFSRSGQELRITPRTGIVQGARFVVEVAYAGIPNGGTTGPVSGIDGGFIATDDGFTIAGQPDSAAQWFPVNDHPDDAATYAFHVTVPTGLSVVANGRLVGTEVEGDRTTWNWRADEPMASYLTTVDVGEFDISDYTTPGGLQVYDAIDSDLVARPQPTTGTHLAISQKASATYKRLMHVIDVPADGATVGFTMTRDTEPGWDYVFVEAHTVGQDDWTTLEDQNGHTTQDTGRVCRSWPDERPFISKHYMTVDQKEGTCSPTGATGVWWAANGRSDGPEPWQVDLSAFAGKQVEVSITYASDSSYQMSGVFVDDIDVSTGQGTTSFEDGLDGWTVPGPPAGKANENDWVVGTVADEPPTTGELVQQSFAREPEIVRFLSSHFGPYPWQQVGGIVDDVEGLGFALETQTRPVYDPVFFTDEVSGASVIVHELAHQWYGDSVRLHRWQSIWLNEGFATYAEWLWSQHEGIASVQEVADQNYASYPKNDPFWKIKIGDPGSKHLFDNPVYTRGALALQALRLKIGSKDFFRILRGWPKAQGGRAVVIKQFEKYAEKVSGKQLDDLFHAWLYSKHRPPQPSPQAGHHRAADVPAPARSRLVR